VAGPPGLEDPGPPAPEAGIIKADVSVSYLSGDRWEIGGFLKMVKVGSGYIIIS